MSSQILDTLIELIRPNMSSVSVGSFPEKSSVKSGDVCQFSTTFELFFEKGCLEYVVSSTLTYLDTNWALRFYPTSGSASSASIQEGTEDALVAIYFLGGGGGQVVADCSLTILNHKSANLNIVKEFKDVVFSKTYPENSIGFHTNSNALMHSRYGYFANGLLSVKADVCIKSIADSASDYRLCSQLATLLFDDSTSDLAVFVGYEQIAAHKVILAARSAVFRDIFAHSLSESDSAVSEYVISDFDAFVVRAFLSYLYKDSIDAYSLSLHARELFTMASRYQIQSLVTLCEDHLSSTLCVDNAVDILLLARDNKSSSLQSDAIDFLVRHFSTVFSVDGVASRLGLSLCEEVFKAVAGRMVCIREMPRIVD
jgi:hypothetical protein